MAAVGLVASGGGAAQLGAALRYLFATLLGSGAYLLGVALVYGAYGTVSIELLLPLVDADAPARRLVRRRADARRADAEDGAVSLPLLAAAGARRRAGAGLGAALGAGGEGLLLPHPAPVARALRAARRRHRLAAGAARQRRDPVGLVAGDPRRAPETSGCLVDGGAARLSVPHFSADRGAGSGARRRRHAGGVARSGQGGDVRRRRGGDPRHRPRHRRRRGRRRRAPAADAVRLRAGRRHADGPAALGRLPRQVAADRCRAGAGRLGAGGGGHRRRAAGGDVRLPRAAPGLPRRTRGGSGAPRTAAAGVDGLRAGGGDSVLLGCLRGMAVGCAWPAGRWAGFGAAR